MIHLDAAHVSVLACNTALLVGALQPFMKCVDQKCVHSVNYELLVNHPFS